MWKALVKGTPVKVDAASKTVTLTVPARSVTTFEVDGVSYEGISTDSPIYPAIEGLRAGDSFTFRDASQSIDFLA